MGKRKGLTGVLAILLVLAVVLSLRAQEPAPENLTGKVVKIEPRRIIVTTDDGKEQVVKAKTEMLQGIAIGDRIEVDKTRKLIRILEKAETSAAPPAGPSEGSKNTD
jgi:flagellin-like protein